MKASKISIVVLLALTLSLGLAASAWARPGGGGMGGGMGCGMMGAMNLSPDQAGKLFDLKEKFHADTAATRKQVMVKHAELAALWKAEKPDEKAIVAMQKELNALKGQLQEKRVAFQLEARKIAPQLAKVGHGMGMGHGGGFMGGPGRGMGPGGCPMAGPGGGPGPGPAAPAAPAK
jgi:zinc resistance-associated protein